MSILTHTNLPAANRNAVVGSICKQIYPRARRGRERGGRAAGQRRKSLPWLLQTGAEDA